MSNKQNILIVCWEFPPHNAIGGRRWAKIAKSLIRAGHSVSVITSHVATPGTKLSWISEKEFSQIKLYALPDHFLVTWLNDYHSKLSFLKLRIAKTLITLRTKGTIYDRAIGVGADFRKLALKVIKDDHIDTVFVTGAPFNLVYFTALLKKVFPRLRIVADYRDPWINAQNYGMKNLSPQRLEAEQQKQNQVFELADYITAPNRFLLNEIKETYTGRSQRVATFTELPHAFDPDDVIKVSAQTPKDSVKIVYGGTLYLGIEEHLELLNAAISRYKKQPGAKPLEVIFYTSEQNKQSIFADNADCVKFCNPIGDRIFEEVAKANFILILLSEHNKNYVTSKYFEFLPYRKPYLYVGPPGFVADKTEQEGFGYCLRSADQLGAIIDRQLAATATPASGSSLERYTFDAVTSDLLKAIQ